jgi:hypothetical protein
MCRGSSLRIPPLVLSRLLTRVGVPWAARLALYVRCLHTPACYLSQVEVGGFHDEREVAKRRAARAWHGAEQLECFASLNCEALARLAKFVDRSQHHSTAGATLLRALPGPVQGLLATPEKLAPLRRRIRDFVARNWYGNDGGGGGEGGMSAAMEYLCHVPTTPAAPRNHFAAGFTSGVSICFLISVAHLLVGADHEAMAWSPHYMFYHYRPSGCFALAVLLWALNVQIFQVYGVNHVFVLQTSVEHRIHASQLMWIGCGWTLMLLGACSLQLSTVLDRHSVGARALRSFCAAAVLTEIRLCDACSCQEITAGWERPPRGSRAGAAAARRVVLLPRALPLAGQAAAQHHPLHDAAHPW